MAESHRGFLASLDIDDLIDVISRSREEFRTLSAFRTRGAREIKAYMLHTCSEATEFADFLKNELTEKGDPKEFGNGVWLGALMMLHSIRVVAETQEMRGIPEEPVWFERT